MAAKNVRTETKIAKAVSSAGVVSPEAAAVISQHLGIQKTTDTVVDMTAKSGIVLTTRNAAGEIVVEEIPQHEADGLARLWEKAQTEGHSFQQFASLLNERERSIMELQVPPELAATLAKVEEEEEEAQPDVSTMTEADMDAAELAAVRAQWEVCKGVGVSKEQYLALVAASEGDYVRRLVEKFVDFGDGVKPIAAVTVAPVAVTTKPALPAGVSQDDVDKIAKVWKKAKKAGMDKKQFLAFCADDAFSQDVIKAILKYIKLTSGDGGPVAVPTTTAAPAIESFLTPLDSAAKGKKGNVTTQSGENFSKQLIEMKNDIIPRRY